MDVIPFLQCVECTTQLADVSQLAEGDLHPTGHIADKDVQQHQSQTQPLGNFTCHWSPLGHWPIDHNSLSAIIQPIPFVLSYLCARSMSTQFKRPGCCLCWTLSKALHKSRWIHRVFCIGRDPQGSLSPALGEPTTSVLLAPCSDQLASSTNAVVVEYTKSVRHDLTLVKPY